MPKNLFVIEGSIEKVTQDLWEATGTSDEFHFTQGSFASSEEVAATILGFKHVDQNIADKDGVFVIVVNSDVGMYRGEENDDAIFGALEAAAHVAKQFPERSIYLISYDGGKPFALYSDLANSNFKLASFFNIRGDNDEAFEQVAEFFLENFDIGLEQDEVKAAANLWLQGDLKAPVPLGFR